MATSRRERRLAERLSDHRASVEEFTRKARALDPGQWLTPRGEGKWTPAQETKHVILSYDELLRQLTGGPPMRMRAAGLRRLIARWIGLTSILYRKRIPVAARAPREVRPEEEASPSPELVARLESTTRAFDELYASRWREQPRTRLTHHLFGPLTLDQAIRVMTVHTRHHAAFLPGGANGAFRR